MFIRGFSLLFLGLGIFVLMQVVSPYIAFKSWELLAFDQNSLLADPNPSNGLAGSGVLGVSIENRGDFPAFISKNGNIKQPLYKEFKLSVPSISLENVIVAVYSNDFDNMLAQLPGTAMPGEKGNVFITGHSSLPQNIAVNRKAFFINLPNVKKGDRVFADVLGQRFTYEVLGLRIVDPKDVSVIDPPDSGGRYLSLMTCVPPGFNTKRLVVFAKLQS